MIAHLGDPKRRLLMPWIPNGRPGRVAPYVVAAEGLLGLVVGVGSWQPGSFEVSRSCRSSSPAGAIMAPTVIAAGLATSRTDWRPLSRCFGAGIAGVLPTYVASTIISPFGYSPGTFAGILGFLGIYAVVVIAAQATFAPQPDTIPLRRSTRQVIVASATVVVALLLYVGGISA